MCDIAWVIQHNVWRPSGTSVSVFSFLLSIFNVCIFAQLCFRFFFLPNSTKMMMNCGDGSQGFRSDIQSFSIYSSISNVDFSSLNGFCFVWINFPIILPSSKIIIEQFETIWIPMKINWQQLWKLLLSPSTMMIKMIII